MRVNETRDKAEKERKWMKRKIWGGKKKEKIWEERERERERLKIDNNNKK